VDLLDMVMNSGFFDNGFTAERTFYQFMIGIKKNVFKHLL